MGVRFVLPSTGSALFRGRVCTAAVRGLRSAPGARSEPAICSADNSMPKALPVKSTLPEVIITPVAPAPTALMMRPTSWVALIARIRAQPAGRSAAMTGAESALAAKTARARCCCGSGSRFRRPRRGQHRWPGIRTCQSDLPPAWPPRSTSRTSTTSTSAERHRPPHPKTGQGDRTNTPNRPASGHAERLPPNW